MNNSDNANTAFNEINANNEKENKELFPIFENRIEERKDNTLRKSTANKKKEASDAVMTSNDENSLTSNKDGSFKIKPKLNFNKTSLDKLPPEDERFLSTDSAARYLDCSKNALRIKAYRGQVKYYKFGRKLLFKKSDLDASLTLMERTPTGRIQQQREGKFNL